jgi:hypothetical protein
VTGPPSPVWPPTWLVPLKSVMIPLDIWTFLIVDEEPHVMYMDAPLVSINSPSG